MSELILDIHRPIIEKAKKGHEKSLKQLYDLYAKAMYNICYRMLNSMEEAEDVLQEVFIDIFGKLDSFRYDSTFGAWIKRITINKCINELKRKKISLELKDEFYPEELIQDTNEPAEYAYSVEQIKHAMALLPDGYRVIFSLFLMEGFDHQEISEILNISISTSKSQLARAKKKLIEILKAGKMSYTMN